MATRTLQVVIEGNETGARRAFSGVDSAAGQAATGVRSKLGGAFSQLDTLLGSFGIPFSNVLGQLGTKLDDFESKGASNFQKLGEAGKAVALGLTAVAAGIAIESVHLADSYEKVHANLETAFKNSGSSLDAYSGKIDAQASKFATLGHNQTDYEAALGALTTALNNPNKALSEMGLVADVAAKSGKGLKESAIAVAKAQEGQLRPLKQLGIDLPIAATSAVKLKTAQDGLARAQLIGAGIQAKVASGQLTGQKATDALNKAFLGVAAAQDKVNTAEGTGDAVLKALHERLGGAAAAQAATFQGKLKAMRAELENVGIKIGIFLIPIIDTLVGWLSVSITWFEKHKTIALILAGVIGGVLVAAIGAMVVGLFTAGGALAFLLTPAAAVVAAVIAIAAAAIFVWTHWDQIWNWIKDHPAYAVIIAILAWPIAAFVLIIGGLKTLWENWDQIWGWIKQAASDARDWIVTAFNDVITFFQNLPGAIWGAILSLPGILLGVFADAMSAAWGAVGSGVSNLLAWFTGLPGEIVGAIGDLGSLLFDIGASVLHGLIRGAKSVLGDVKNFFGGIADDLTSWKGPPEKDARLLIPAGQLIMDSFVKGAASRLGAVQDFFTGIAPSIAADVGVSFTPSSIPNAAAIPAANVNQPAGGGVSTLVIPLQVDGKTLTEIMVTNLNTPGGPQIRSRAVSNR